jgi:chromate transporter
MMTTTTIPNGQISELVRYFLRLGFLGVGGPVALVGQMERKLVGERQWLMKKQIREAIAICQSLSGLDEIGAISTHRWRST